MSMSIDEIIESYTETASGVTSFTSTVFSDVVNLLIEAGYTPKESDLWLLNFATTKVHEDILNSTNQRSVPDGLMKGSVGLIVAEFLKIKMANASLTADETSGIHFLAVVKKLAEGDTAIEWDTNSSQSPEQRMMEFLQMMNNYRQKFIKYRCLSW